MATLSPEELKSLAQGKPEDLKVANSENDSLPDSSIGKLPDNTASKDKPSAV